MATKANCSKTLVTTEDFIAEQKRRAQLKVNLDKETDRLNSLYNELGKIAYHGGPYINGRTHDVLVCEINECKKNIDIMKKDLSTPAQL